LIIKHICSNVEFISINILNENLATDGRVLIHAIEQTVQFKPDIIHMSLGTTKWRHILPIKRIIKQARKKNIIVVSAADNEGSRSYPAYLKGVVGVKALNTGKFEDMYFQKGFFFAPFHTWGIPGTEGLKSKNCGGSSMAAAYVTGAIARIKLENSLYTGEETQKKIGSICKTKNKKGALKCHRIQKY
jgi:hypothetical protein